MKLVHWTRFIWDLAKLPPAESVPIDARYIVRAATRREKKSVRHVIATAFALDPDWSDTLKSVQEWMDERINEEFSHRNVLCLVVMHGTRIIGASLLDPDREAESNLVTGPCILNEYRSRGIGTALLYLSLCALRDAGLSEARALTKGHVPAAKFVYPKFESVSEPVDSVPHMVGS